MVNQNTISTQPKLTGTALTVTEVAATIPYMIFVHVVTTLTSTRYAVLLAFVSTPTLTASSLFKFKRYNL